MWPHTAEPLTPADLARLREGVYGLVAQYGGSFSAEHGLGPLLQSTYRTHTPEAVRKASARVVASLTGQKAAQEGTFDFG